MPQPKRRSIHSIVIPVLCLGLAGAAGALGQNNLPQPLVGGVGTFPGGPAAAPAAANGPVRQRLNALGAVPADFSTLKLAPGFLLAMDVYDTPEYDLELRIDTDGNINIPMAGPIHVADLTLGQASMQVATALKERKILVDPQINLNVEEYAGSDVTILGEIRAPGRIEMLAPKHLDDVIALAGGETEFSGNEIEIRHQEGVSQPIDVIHYSQSERNHIVHDAMVLPGDTVTVKRAGIVYVLGGVTRPGGYVMQEGGNLDVSEALSLAYGTTLDAAVGSIRLIRKQPDGKVMEIPIPYRDMVKGKVAPMQLQAQDVLYVPLSKLKVIVTQGLLASASQAAIYTYH